VGSAPARSRPSLSISTIEVLKILETLGIWRERSNHMVCFAARKRKTAEEMVNGLIYLVGLIVIIMFILSFFGLR
jgi:hypothetical protein